MKTNHCNLATFQEGTEHVQVVFRSSPDSGNFASCEAKIPPRKIKEADFSQLNSDTMGYTEDIKIYKGRNWYTRDLLYVYNCMYNILSWRHWHDDDSGVAIPKWPLFRWVNFDLILSTWQFMIISSLGFIILQLMMLYIVVIDCSFIYCFKSGVRPCLQRVIPDPIFCLSSSLRIGVITYPGLVEEFSDRVHFRKRRLHIKIIKEYLLMFRVIFFDDLNKDLTFRLIDAYSFL